MFLPLVSLDFCNYCKGLCDSVMKNSGNSNLFKVVPLPPGERDDTCLHPQGGGLGEGEISILFWDLY